MEPRATLRDELDLTYERLHTAKEDAFWVAKMGLAEDGEAAQAELDHLEVQLQAFLQDPARLEQVRAALPNAQGEERVALEGWERTFAAHVIDSAQGRALAAELVADEGRLERARGEMRLGYADPSKGFVPASSVKLGVMLRSERDERLRRAAWEGLRSIEPFVIEAGFLDILRKRNRLGRMLGAEDYYDWKTRRSEGMSKVEVFALLDDLEERTRESAEAAVEELVRRQGGPIAPWNLHELIAGDITREQDAYFPFGAALERWGRSFAAMGVAFAGAELVLDLVDRPGKYENGFMHGPVVAWRKGGRHRPARIQFTANAIPGMVGSGLRATQTLFHEGGHAAHFANVDMPSPCFGQEFAPTSVAFAETQSMLLDSLLDDADWRHRYARNKAHQPMPFALIERGLRCEQPFASWQARAMLAVCYGERALYEIPEEELSPRRILAELRAVERRLLFLDQGSPRPILSVPHLLSGESSAYYHGYVLAEIAVHQTRAFFVARDGHLVDNPRLGPDLRQAYWQPGNSVGFAALVERLTGRPLSAADYSARLNRGADAAVEEARDQIERLRAISPLQGPVRLDARVRVMHGREIVAELDGGDFDAFVTVFEDWVDGRPEP